MTPKTLNAVVAAGLDERVFTAASFAVARHGELVALEASGHVDDRPGAPAVDRDTLFDVASLTKPVVAASAILQLVDSRKLRLDDTVADLLVMPAGANEATGRIGIHDMLTHTAGLPAAPPEVAQADHRPGADRVVNATLSTPLISEPGGSYRYSDCGYILLGRIIETVSGRSLSEYARDHIFAPLGMSASGFLPDTSDAIAATDRQLPPGIVHDPRARSMGGVAGHAGVFATASDLIRFGEAVRTTNPALLSERACAKMLHSQIAPAIGYHSYGWFCHGAPLFPGGDILGRDAVAHSGFTGCVLIVDPALSMTATLLTNRVYSNPTDNSSYLAFRRQWIAQLCAH